MKKIIPVVLIAVFTFVSFGHIVSAAGATYYAGDIVSGKYIRVFNVTDVPKKDGKGKVTIKVERGEGYGMKVYLDCYQDEISITKSKKSLACEKWTNTSKKKDSFTFEYKNLTDRQVDLAVTLAEYNKSGGVEKQISIPLTIAPGKVVKESSSSLYAISKTDHVRGGDKNSKVVIITYSDLECPFCAQFNETTKRLERDYGDKVAFVYRHFPLTEIHRSALPAARASECVAASKGNSAFFAFVDELFSEQYGSFDFETLEVAAQNAGMKSSDFNKCMDSTDHLDLVKQQREDAITTGGNGTPHSIIIGKNGKKEIIQGAQPYPVMKDLIDSYLK